MDMTRDYYTDLKLPSAASAKAIRDRYLQLGTFYDKIAVEEGLTLLQ
jgi:curved DNA-binding protein CbpA